MRTPEALSDVAGYLNLCADGFDQLAAILKTIKAESAKESRLHALAGAGLHIASDMRELGRCWHDDVRENGVES